MDNIPKMTVIRQCLSLLPTLSPTCVPLDYGVKKLRTLALLQLSVTAHLLRWESYREYAWQLDASPDLQELLGLPSISASQVSRRMNQLPTALLEHLFYALTHLIKNLSRPASSGLLQRVGRLLLVDASCLKLPAFLSDWARVTRDRCGVKIHVSYAVTSPEHTFVQHMVPSTGNVSDYEGSDLLLHEEEVTYVLDRGYVCYERMDRWIEGGLNFVMRIADHHQANVLHEHPVPEGSRILRDATVQMGSGYTAMEQRVRLVEFTDEKGRLYRIVTTQWEASAEDIAEIYKHRWLIELFFKWLKQHLRLVRLQSTQPQGIWNHLYLSLIAHALTLYIRYTQAPEKTEWEVLKRLRIHAAKEHTWEEFIQELNRRPTRTSKGRRKTGAKRRTPTLDHPVAYTKAVNEKRIVDRKQKKAGIEQNKNNK